MISRLGHILVTLCVGLALTAASPAQGADDPEIGVRTGEHKGFSRLVFDWPEATGYSVEQAPGLAVVRFERAARLDLRRYHRDPPSGLLSLTPRPAAKSLSVALALAPGVTLRHFRDGPRVVLDLQADPGAPEQPSAAPAGAPPSPKFKAASARSIFADARRATLTQERTAGTVAPVRLTARAAEPAAKPGPQVDKAASKARSGGVVAEYDRPALPELVPVPGARAPRRRPLVLRLDWPEEVAAAAFRAGRELWLLFDAPTRANLAKQIRNVAPELERVEQDSVGGATVLRLLVPGDVAPELRREGRLWVVDLRRRLGTPESEPEFRFMAGRPEGRLALPAGAAGSLVALDVPALGGRVFVLPVSAPVGLRERREFPRFRALATYQGLVVDLLSDDLRVTAATDGLRIVGRSDLEITPAPPGGDAASPTKAMALSGRRLFNLEAWRRGGPEHYELARQTLQRAVVAPSGGQDVEIARLELARFHFAHGLGAEALSVLDLMAEGEDPFGSDPEVILLRGAGAFLERDYPAASAALDHPALSGEPEAWLWQAALAAAAQDWPYAVDLFTRTEALIGDYAQPVRTRLRLLFAEARLGVGDTGGASLVLDQAREDRPNALQRAQIDYLEGHRLLGVLKREPAVEIWRQVARSTHLAAQARARLALVELGLEDKRLSPDEAVAELERMRFLWRGDQFEVALLERLAALYVDRGRHRDALHTLRQAASHFPDSPRAALATRRMGEIFSDLFVGPPAETLQPIRALALFEEFKELTPPGKDGDAIIGALIDRLVEIDLLDRATELLEAQISQRFEGRDVPAGGARLALIRLLDRDPEGALDSLDRTARPAPTNDLARQRHHLRAKALAQLGRSGESLALLSGDDSVDARRLRAEILWDQGDWPAAAVALGRLLPAPPAAGEALPPEARQAVINAAMAHTLAGDRAGLRDLRRRFSAAMADTPDADSFGLLTSDYGRADITAVVQELADVQQIRSFMAFYRARLADAGLSGVN